MQLVDRPQIQLVDLALTIKPATTIIKVESNNGLEFYGKAYELFESPDVQPSVIHGLVDTVKFTKSEVIITLEDLNKSQNRTNI